MRIALLSHMHHPISEPYQGGTEAHTAMLADTLVARGHDVTLFAKEGSVSTALVHPLVPADFEFVNHASPLVRKQQRGFLAESVHHSVELIRAGDYDVVVNNSLSSLPYSLMDDLPMLTILHTPANLDDVTAIVGRPGWAPSPLHAWVTVSESNARDWRRMLPEVGVVHNGIRLERWRSAAAARPGVAVWAARITPEKGLHLAIDAVRAAGMQLEFAGPISRTDYFDEQIAPRLGADVRYRGHLRHGDLADFYSSGAVFIASPLWAEPFGLSTVEALACGTPVAALPFGAARELIGPRSGALARTVDVSSLASAIDRASVLDRRNARAASARFGVDRMVDGYESLLRELTGLGAGDVERSA